MHRGPIYLNRSIIFRHYNLVAFIHFRSLRRVRKRSTVNPTRHCVPGRNPICIATPPSADDRRPRAMARSLPGRTQGVGEGGMSAYLSIAKVHASRFAFNSHVRGSNNKHSYGRNCRPAKLLGRHARRRALGLIRE